MLFRSQEKRPKESETHSRRGFFAWLASIAGILLAVIGLLWTFASLQMLVPNTRSSRRKLVRLGNIDRFTVGLIDTQWKDEFRIFVVCDMEEGEGRIFVLSAECTHLGCVVRWQSGSRLFQCPCHGSRFAQSGLRLSGPAPSPLPRFAIERLADGQLEVDLSRKFYEQKGEWNDPASFVSLNDSPPKETSEPNA